MMTMMMTMMVTTMMMTTMMMMMTMTVKLQVVIFPECRPLLELSGEVECLGALSGVLNDHDRDHEE